MIKIIRHDGKWRVIIENETLEFEDEELFLEELEHILKIKKGYEPYNNK